MSVPNISVHNLLLEMGGGWVGGREGGVEEHERRGVRGRRRGEGVGREEGMRGRRRGEGVGREEGMRGYH